MRKIGEYLSVFAIGGGGYSLLEIMWRGYTHWSMTITGGVCFMLIYLTDSKFNHEPLWKRCFLGSLLITMAELIVGFVVNILLEWDVWDYSKQFLNIRGQICALYSTLWFFLCIPAIYLCGLIKKKLFGAKS